MSAAALRKLVKRRGEIGKLLSRLSADWGIPFSLEDADGSLLFDEPAVDHAFRFPIQHEGLVVGWVVGDEKAAPLAALLEYVLVQEDEKKSLVGELTDRYRELSLLYHLSERIAASPQPEAVSEIALEEVRRLIKADAGAIILLSEGSMQTVVSFGTAYQYLCDAGLLEQILSTGKAALANEIPVEDCIAGEQGYQVSILGAPLKTDRRRLGVIVLVGSQSQMFTAGELKLLNTIAMQVAPALEISRLYQESIEKARFEHELKMARQVQESLLPLHLPEIPGWVVASRWRPAREVSGDFYDVITENDHAVDLVIADVTDKGMPAALFMAFTRSILRVSIHSRDEPASIISEVNQSICRDSYEGLFTTLVYARLDPKTGLLTYVNAGHNPPLLYHARSGVVEKLGRTGLILGVDLDSTYTQKSAQMEVGDFLLFYTDGITEATNPNQEAFGIERLNRQVLQYRDCVVENILDEVETAVLEFTGQSQQLDDMTIMGLKRTQILEE